MKDTNPLWLAYLWESWGPSGRVDEFLAERAKGANAYKAKQELGQVFDTGGEHAARQWVVEAAESWLSDRKILKSLERELKNLIKREQNHQSRPKRHQDRIVSRASYRR